MFRLAALAAPRYFASTRSAMAPEIQALVDKTIADNKVVVFSKSYCPYCKRAKQYLAQDTTDLLVLELDEREDGSQIQAYLPTLSGFSTVPQIFINKESIGGSSDLLKLSHDQVKAKIAA
ncbi:glutaredoxin [Cryptococcus wingfieldii CBS 7118]|uniref:Glutaredoxin n=1 Tax=Cryptococcus wingfieldii CBS 7118 TaxID=1295528 RepID=A0A1E3J6B6_9TREE|nr:glutaredoxin [Cryptococcus wingfieldii CBS 7118]ODN96382.1 glutaredoxin [Cryptococcus wingfieldii CBS 7118]